MKIIIGFLSLSIFFLIGCADKKSAEDLFNEGEKNLEESKIPEAVSSYETLINEYPNDKLAPDATARLASIYQNKQVKNVPETQSLLKSVELFRSVYEKYPNSEQAPMGLFMAGFVEANELNDYDAATKTYNLFLETFPDHELATSAKEELDNMGLTPEEILKKNITREQN
jgi:TolA-binding protein